MEKPKIMNIVFVRFYETEEEILERVYKKLKEKGLENKQFYLDYEWSKSPLLTVRFKEEINI